MIKFYGLLLEQIKELGTILDRIEHSTSMNEISEYEVKVRQVCERIIISASMVPNKDVYALSMQKRREIQDSVMSPAERVREILAKPESNTVAKPATKRKKATERKKNGNK